VSKAEEAGDGSAPLAPISPSRLTQIIFAASEGKADSADVCQVLNMFYRLANENRPIPRPLIDFVAASFGRYLGYKDFHGPDERGARSLDSAFGLLRREGRPDADEPRRIEMAAAVLRLRLKKIPHQSALESAAKECGSNTATIGEAWRAHLMSAITVIRNQRDRDGYPWIEEEERILRAIMDDHMKRSQIAPKVRAQRKSSK
jgi:hypothetical protein